MKKLMLHWPRLNLNVMLKPISDRVKLIDVSIISVRERRRSRGEKDDDDDDDDSDLEDPKIQRELDEISKIKNESGIGSVIYKELTERKILPHKALDPWKASRAPNAKYEPRYRTRYQSPMFACKFYHSLEIFV